MKAIILAAGYATRLYPLTKDRAKPLLPIGGKPIIDYIVDEINTVEDVNEIFVVTNDKFAAQFEKWAEEKNNPTKITVFNDGTLTEDTRLGAIGDINFTIDKAGIDEDLMIIAGDNYFTYKLKEYYDFFIEKGKDCIVVKKFDDMERIKQLGVALVDENGKVINIEEKPQQPKSDTAVFATYMYLKETVPMFKEYLAKGNMPDAPGYFIQWLYKEKDLYAYKMNGDCFDIGTKEAYEEIQEMFK